MVLDIALTVPTCSHSTDLTPTSCTGHFTERSQWSPKKNFQLAFPDNKTSHLPTTPCSRELCPWGGSHGRKDSKFPALYIFFAPLHYLDVFSLSIFPDAFFSLVAIILSHISLHPLHYSTIHSSCFLCQSLVTCSITKLMMSCLTDNKTSSQLKWFYMGNNKTASVYGLHHKLTFPMHSSNTSIT